MDPLRFNPLLKRLRWGGRRLGTVLGKPIGAGHDYAESWELCDHGADQSVVADGPLVGWSLGRLVQERGAELLGRHAGIRQFPLLFKYLDASDRLSVQVHPNDEQARAHQPGELGKTEAWVILDAAPGSVVYAGLKCDVTRATLAAAIARGTVEDCLHRVPVAAGDCIFIPAGTVHAIGEGILLAEVQQSSDLTYRLFDWNRVGADGKPRPLHIDESLACIDFGRGPVSALVPRRLSHNGGDSVEELVRCPYFTLLRHTASRPVALSFDDRCHALMLLEGSVRIDDREGGLVLERGATLLFPAASLPQIVEPLGRSVFLQVFWE
jgi:mannose-6-phosphate isomerase